MAAALQKEQTPKVKWESDLEKYVLLSNFDKRGWVRGSYESQYLKLLCLLEQK